MRIAAIKKRLYGILEAQPFDRASRAVAFFLVSLIILNVMAVILGTVPAVQARYAAIFTYFEIFSVVVFSAEYVLRMWCITESDAFRGALAGRVRYAFTGRALIDIAAILPFYLPFTGMIDLRVLRALRLFRLVRLMKIGRYSESIQLLGRILKSKREELTLAFMLLVILLVISSSLMFFVENNAQPDRFSSIPAAMWWAVATLTTVGYGDIAPVTPLGKVLGSLVAILGIAMFALPTSIIGAGFFEELQARKGRKTCPHCGKEI